MKTKEENLDSLIISVCHLLKGLSVKDAETVLTSAQNLIKTSSVFTEDSKEYQDAVKDLNCY